MNMSDAEEVAKLIEALDKRQSKPLAAFLAPDDIATLTGRKLKGHQIDALRKMGIPFFVNATGHPVVTRAAVEGKSAAHHVEKQPWIPPGMRKK